MIVTEVCAPHKVPPVRTVDEILASSPLAGLWRVSRGGGDRRVALVRLAERFADLDDAPAGSLVVLSRAASAELSDYRLDMGLRWASANRVSAVAAFSAEQWQPTVTAMDIAGRADIALISIPATAELAGLVQAISREIGGGAESALGRAEEGLNAVLAAETAGASLDDLRAAVSGALGTPRRIPSRGDGRRGARPGGRPRRRPGRSRRSRAGPGGRPGGRGQRAGHHRRGADRRSGRAGRPRGPGHRGAAGPAQRRRLSRRLLDLARRAREVPVRSRSELLAELLLSESAINDDLLDRARQLNVMLGGWHVAVRIEADDLDGPGPDGSGPDGPGSHGPGSHGSSRDEVRRFELVEAAGQIALQAAGAAGGTWHLFRVARAVVLVKMTRSDPGPQAGAGRPVRRPRAAGPAGAAARAAVPGRGGVSP